MAALILRVRAPSEDAARKEAWRRIRLAFPTLHRRVRVLDVRPVGDGAWDVAYLIYPGA